MFVPLFPVGWGSIRGRGASWSLAPGSGPQLEEHPKACIGLSAGAALGLLARAARPGFQRSAPGVGAREEHRSHACRLPSAGSSRQSPLHGGVSVALYGQPVGCEALMQPSLGNAVCHSQGFEAGTV